ASALRGRPDVLAHEMAPGAAARHMLVLGGHAAERDDNLARPGDGFPGYRRPEFVHWRDDVGEDDARCAGTVGIDGIGVSADHVQEPVDEALGVMHAAGARPAVGAAEDVLVAERANTFELAGDQA